ncbi:MAG: hypothetical protein GX295_05045 [Syntrophomonadaceae bacterium]|nr:hypothetical protein [Syntrophomonadaceae bacterium]
MVLISSLFLSVQWWSDNPKVARVYQGKLTPVGPGKTKINAYFCGKKTRCTVEVQSN